MFQTKLLRLPSQKLEIFRTPNHHLKLSYLYLPYLILSPFLLHNFSCLSIPPNPPTHTHTCAHKLGWAGMVRDHEFSNFSHLSQCLGNFCCVTVGCIGLQCVVGRVQLWLLVWCWVGSAVSRCGGATLAVLLFFSGLSGDIAEWSRTWLAALHQWVPVPL